MMWAVRAILPVASVIIALVLVLLPWGIAADEWPVWRFIVPFAPLGLIHYWLMRRPATMPFPLVFLAGLVVDGVTHGPLGFWALVYLIGGAVVRLAGGQLHSSTLGRFAAFAAGFVLVGAVTWGLATGYYLRQIEVQPILAAVGLLIVCYPLLAVLFSPMVERRRRVPNLSLDRGR
jgi:rod shape-determining protein MreD